MGCFLMAGLWAGAISTYLALDPGRHISHTAEVTGFVGRVEAARQKFFFKKSEDRSEDSTPYDEKTAPDLGKAPETEGFEFAAPVGPPEAEKETPPAVVAPPVVVAPLAAEAGTEAGPLESINGALGSLQKLFAGDGSFKDVIEIAVAAFAVFGGVQFGSSDMLFKFVLGLFSKKGNFNAILEDKIGATGGRRARRRARSGK